MPAYIALLRGVNIAGKNRLPMKELAGLCEQAGLLRVRTYIQSGNIVFEATDAASFVTRAEYSVNGGEWQTVYADDGISDSPKERYTIDLVLKTPGEYSVTLRAYDVNSNSGNARVVVRR